MTRTGRVLILALVLGGVAGCERQAAPVPDTVASVTAAASTQGTGAAANGPLCPRTGHWGACELRIRLEQSGLAPIPTTEKVGEVPQMKVAPVSFMIGTAGMAAYFFADTMARHLAAAALDTSKFIPPSRDVSMHAEATAIQSDNLLAILFSRNEHQRERVSDAITAGPPQP